MFLFVSLLEYVVIVVVPETDKIRSKFQRIPSNSMRGVVAKETFESLSLEDCAEACLADRVFECVSFDYQTSLSKCLLYDQVAETTGGLQHTEGTDHYTLHKGENPNWTSLKCQAPYRMRLMF